MPIKLTATGQRLEITETEPLTSGSERYYTAEFTFDAAWDDMKRTAVFSALGRTVSVLLDATGVVQIPWEVLARGNASLGISVFGVRGGEVVLTTNYASAGTIIKGADRDAVAAEEPTPGVYEQILALLDTAITADQIGAPGGIAPLDVDRRLPEANLTKIAFVESITNTEMEEMLK